MRISFRLPAAALLLAILLALFCLHNPARAEPLELITDSGEILTLSLEEYLPGAVAAEMPALFPEEALRAQAVAIRSYVLSAGARHENADLCTHSGCCLGWLDSDALQALWGADYDAYRQCIDQACRDTQGQYLAYNGQPAQTVFHASSRGQTESSSALWNAVPYLVSVPSPESAETVPNLETELRLSAAELAALLGTDSTAVTGLSSTDSGRVAFVTIGGQSFTGEELRSRLGLRSTSFTLEQENGQVIFHVSGYGHGVGMSQYGAKLYAGMGLNYREILSHYYPGTTLRTLPA